jgi:glycerol-3-phosphate cytidylyltransferase
MHKIGFIAGSFDVIHPGYISMFVEAKQYCEHLVVGMHIDPSIERPEKLPPVLSWVERYSILNSIKYIDAISFYNTEEDLVNLLSIVKPDIRFLGDDYKDKPHTGDKLNIPIHYLDRSHGWSTTKFKKLISDSLK